MRRLDLKHLEDMHGGRLRVVAMNGPAERHTPWSWWLWVDSIMSARHLKHTNSR